jgi:hypothetical protein
MTNLNIPLRSIEQFSSSVPDKDPDQVDIRKQMTSRIRILSYF